MHPPGLAPLHRITLCPIAQNEEATLAACLASVADTGSTDRPCAVAAAHGASVVDSPGALTSRAT
jgi:hypothetical protein